MNERCGLNASKMNLDGLLGLLVILDWNDVPRISLYLILEGLMLGE